MQTYHATFAGDIQILTWSLTLTQPQAHKNERLSNQTEDGFHYKLVMAFRSDGSSCPTIGLKRMQLTKLSSSWLAEKNGFSALA